MADAVSQQTPTDSASDYATLAFVVQQLLSCLAGPTLVKVKAVHGGGLAAPPTVDVQPLVNQIDGNGTATPHGIVYGVPTFRYQAGASAYIIDPLVGDIGLACFASRDISAVKTALGQANPGSRRMWDWADGLYLGGFLGLLAATQYIRISPSGINIVSPTMVTINGVTIDPDGNIVAPGTVTAPDVIFNSISAKAHTHTGGTIDGDTGGPMNPA